MGQYKNALHPLDSCLTASSPGGYMYQVEDRTGEAPAAPPLCSEARPACTETISWIPVLTFIRQTVGLLCHVLQVPISGCPQKPPGHGYMKSLLRAWENSLGFTAQPLPWTCTLPNFYPKALYLNCPPLLSIFNSITWVLPSLAFSVD